MDGLGLSRDVILPQVPPPALPAMMKADGRANDNLFSDMATAVPF
jgi:hypothetical protein